MTNTILKATRSFALVAATGFLMGTTALTPVYAADLGGDCCADLEERVAELEATTVTKGNRKVSVKLYGMVSRSIMIWDDGIDDDVYSVGNSSSPSRFGIKGGAKIGSGWSAGFRLEYQLRDTWAKDVDQNNDDGRDGQGPSLRHDVVYLKNARFGTVYLGHTSTSTDGVTEIDLSGAKAIVSSDLGDWNRAFNVGNGQWSDYQENLDGARRDTIRYDTPTYRGFTVSGSFAEDDYYDVALRYAGEFNGVMKIAGGIGYQDYDGEDNDNSPRNQYNALVGSISALHTPTGLNVSFSAGQRDYDGAQESASYWYVKAGLLNRYSRLGKTALYGEYGSYEGDFTGDADAAVGSESSMWGLGVVQKIDTAALEIFASYRHYELGGAAIVAGAPEELDAVMLGAKIKF